MMIFKGFLGRTCIEIIHPGGGNGTLPGPSRQFKIKDTSLQFAGFWNQIPDWKTGTLAIADCWIERTRRQQLQAYSKTAVANIRLAA